PKLPIAVKTIAASPAAGPLTPTLEPLKPPTTIPQIIPAINPENNDAPLASAIPKHKGRATKKTTKLSGKSLFKYLNIYSNNLILQKIRNLILKMNLGILPKNLNIWEMNQKEYLSLVFK